MSIIRSTLFPILLASQSAFAIQYALTDNFQGSNFLDQSKFTYITSDPSGGYVNYLNLATAQSEGLVKVSGNNFTMGVDSSKVVPAGAIGRDSVRIESVKKWLHHVSIYNVAHMPQGCGTWPAIWEVGQSWENDGEIDILEGVNDQGLAITTARSTLHVGPNSGTACSIPSSGVSQTGFVENTVCDHTQGDTGCSVGMTEKNNYGPDFNANGGGFFAMEQTANFIKIWFWPRSSTNIPAEVRSGASSINTDNWPTPSAFFPNIDCNIAAHFHERNLVINTDLCGSWASGAFGSAGCPGTCNDYVQKNPSTFANAFFNILWVKIFQ